MHSPRRVISAVAKAPRRDRGGAESKSRPLRGVARVEGDGIVVRRDAGPGERGLGLLAEETDGREIEEHHVGVGAAADDPDAAVCERGGERAGVCDDVSRVVLELRAKRFPEAHRLGGERVGVKASLHAREDGRLKLLGELLRSREDHSASGPAQGLGRGARHDVGVGQG